jgi:hypothetical protein
MDGKTFPGNIQTNEFDARLARKAYFMFDPSKPVKQNMITK